MVDGAAAVPLIFFEADQVNDGFISTIQPGARNAEIRPLSIAQAQDLFVKLHRTLQISRNDIVMVKLCEGHVPLLLKYHFLVNAIFTLAAFGDKGVFHNS